MKPEMSLATRDTSQNVTFCFSSEETGEVKGLSDPSVPLTSTFNSSNVTFATLMMSGMCRYAATGGRPFPIRYASSAFCLDDEGADLIPGRAKCHKSTSELGRAFSLRLTQS